MCTVDFLKKLNRPTCGIYDCKLQHSFLLHVDSAKSSNNCLSVVNVREKSFFLRTYERPGQGFDEKENCCKYCGMTWMTKAVLQELDERYFEAESLLSSVGAEANIITVEPPRMAVSGYEPELIATS